MPDPTTRYVTGAGAAIAALLLAATLPCVAQSYPTRPVRIVVNVTAGGGVDATARVVAQHLNSVYNQPFIVDNRTGAGGTIGIELVAKAAPDGYTLLICSSGIVTNAAFRPMNYDPIRDFQPVSNLTTTPYIVVVTPSLPVKSIKDLIALARAKPGGVSYATSGVGSITHLGAELLPMLSGTKMLSVPYKGVADAYPAVIGGDVNWMIGAALSSMPLVKAGHLRALAVTTSKRSLALPDLPTVAESGLPGYEVVGWFAMFAPAGTPMALVEKLSAEAKRGLQRPEFARRAEAEATEILGSSPQELARVVKAEMAIWRKVVSTAGIKP
ncbi:MAG: tripartite tricarboxylate transporter substrate binding protein [Betaproteobacteria bacterium]|nr:tripartite tricarboxylate transporter substrate binding protein [Betaproteobacteria bacterium]